MTFSPYSVPDPPEDRSPSSPTATWSASMHSDRMMARKDRIRRARVPDHPIGPVLDQIAAINEIDRLADIDPGVHGATSGAVRVRCIRSRIRVQASLALPLVQLAAGAPASRLAQNKISWRPPVGLQSRFPMLACCRASSVARRAAWGSLDHLVCAQKDRRGYRDAERLRSLEVDRELFRDQWLCFLNGNEELLPLWR